MQYQKELRDSHKKQWQVAFDLGHERSAEYHRLEFERLSEKVIEWAIKTGEANG
tara:strand:+ start:462 stop:623 length:162 start_codon:yes stop_codon:yes gene_type:complete